MSENLYESPKGMEPLPPKAHPPLHRAEIAAGSFILAGVLLVAARSVWLGDWILCTGAAMVIIGLWGAAMVTTRRTSRHV